MDCWWMHWSLVGAVIKRFERTHEGGYALEPEVVRRAITPENEAHCGDESAQSFERADAGEVSCGRSVRSRAASGAQVLVDEVYLDAVYEEHAAKLVPPGAEFVVTSSLTKVYGVSGLRCGWILAEAELARAMWRMNDVYGGDAGASGRTAECGGV